MKTVQTISLQTSSLSRRMVRATATSLGVWPSCLLVIPFALGCVAVLDSESSRTKEREKIIQNQEKVLSIVDKLLQHTSEADLLAACRTLVGSACGRWPAGVPFCLPC